MRRIHLPDRAAPWTCLPPDPIDPIPGLRRQYALALPDRLVPLESDGSLEQFQQAFGIRRSDQSVADVFTQATANTETMRIFRNVWGERHVNTGAVMRDTAAIDTPEQIMAHNEAVLVQHIQELCTLLGLRRVTDTETWIYHRIFE